MRSLAFIILFLSSIFISCKKDSFISSPDARVTISADTLKYDTVFVSAGSTYQQFRIINENDQKLRISSLKLMGGANSVYKMNVDGNSGTGFSNLELEANDSLYVFVQVNIDPSASNLPFVVRDSIRIEYNGKTRWVQLEAWGQNAHFYRNRIINANESWLNDKPYVILGSLLVSPNQTLTINKGCRIYIHADAPLIVDGTLLVNGAKDTIDRVYFTGDRMDDPYKDFPGSWPGIYFRSGSTDNVFNYAVIKNANQAIGLIDPSSNTNPKLVLNESIIDNAYDAGIITSNSSIRARNCLVSNCGQNLSLTKGGSYQFTHCTIASFSNRFFSHRKPVLLLANYASTNNTIITANLDALFRNCIFWGESGFVNDEVSVYKTGSTNFNVNFDYNLWRVQSSPANVTATQVINNQYPQFDSIDVYHNYYIFRLKASSPAVNKAVNAGVISDLDGKPRPVGLPDLGCYEKQ